MAKKHRSQRKMKKTFAKVQLHETEQAMLMMKTEKNEKIVEADTSMKFSNNQPVKAVKVSFCCCYFFLLETNKIKMLNIVNFR
jgi:hypothetical protein